VPRPKPAANQKVKKKKKKQKKKRKIWGQEANRLKTPFFRVMLMKPVLMVKR
jgi:hypothetical protein